MKIGKMVFVQAENSVDFMVKLNDAVRELGCDVTIDYKVNTFDRHSEFGGKIENGVLYTALVTAAAEKENEEKPKRTRASAK